MLLLIFTMASPMHAQQTPTPTMRGYQGTDQASRYTGGFADLATAIDTFWSATFAASAIPYTSPAIVPIDQVLETGCGRQGPESAAFYCPEDFTIYLNPLFLAEAERSVGDFAPVTILAHEWGHHIQILTSAPDPGGNIYELQADCLAGVYALDAEDQGILDPGDITEAVTISQVAADPLALPQDQPGSHGINDDRIKAFMRGYLNGLEACDLPLDGRSQVADQSPATQHQSQGRSPSSPAQPASSYLPRTLPVANASCFSLESQGVYPYVEVVSFLEGAGASGEEINALGWQDGAYFDFRCPNPTSGDPGFLEVVLHRFGSAEGARAALPYWRSGYVPSHTNEVYVCDSSGAFVVCADGTSPSSPPNAAVSALLDQMMAAVS
jgi:hypothetical protein